MPLYDEFIMFCQNLDFELRRDHLKNFLWASRLCVGRQKEPILRYVQKNDKKSSGSSQKVREF